MLETRHSPVTSQSAAAAIGPLGRQNPPGQLYSQLYSCEDIPGNFQTCCLHVCSMRYFLLKTHKQLLFNMKAGVITVTKAAKKQ